MTAIAYDTTLTFILEPGSGAGTGGQAAFYFPGSTGRPAVVPLLAIEILIGFQGRSGYTDQWQLDSVNAVNYNSSNDYHAWSSGQYPASILSPPVYFGAGSHTLRAVVAGNMIGAQVDGVWYDMSGANGSPRTSPIYQTAIGNTPDFVLDAYGETSSPRPDNDGPFPLDYMNTADVHVYYESIATIGGTFWTNRFIAEETV